MGRAWKGFCLLACLIEKAGGEKGSGLCPVSWGDLKSGNTGGGFWPPGNRVFANKDWGDFVNDPPPCRVVPGIPAVGTSTGCF